MAAPVTFETFQQELASLVARFSAGATGFLARDYAEASVRQDFIDPFFTALGWDLKNERQLILNKREVEIESRTLIDGRKKRADYLFRIEGTDRFVCEAKKPFETLGSHYAFQAKRYARNKVLPLALLTDFEELCLYVVAIKPRRSDPVDAGLWKKWHYSNYPAHAREIWDLLSREAVSGGSIDRGLDELPKKPTGKGRARQLWLIRPDRTRAIDADFLAFLDESRRTLGSDLLRHNPHVDLRNDLPRLNEAVQRILDRLLFLRICEDRDIDTGLVLNRALENWFHATGDPRAHRATQDNLPGVEDPPTGTPTLSTHQLWPRLVEHFQELDRRPASSVPFFNGHLFKPHFTEDLHVGDAWLADFLDDLGGDESEYLFAVIPVEILGTIYERFLGKIIRPHGLGVTIENKPEVRKADGIYYTPRYIVDYIVEQTVGKLLDDQPPEKTLDLRLLDPACGSGSFLIRVFERVCEHWQTWLTQQLPAKVEVGGKVDWEKLVEAPVGAKPTTPRAKDARAAWLVQNRQFCWLDEVTGDLHLTMHLKRRILIANIYGVDIDPGAVEVTQLSLYLKMLENENRDTLARERQLFADEAEPALLPPLAANIKCGNSLIASDFSLDSNELVRVRAFDWDVQFATIMKSGGFDAVVGNPPYIRIQTLQESDPESVNYLNEHYAAAAKGNYDIYVVFVERALSLLNPDGRLGYILPHKFFNAQYGEALRQHLAKGKHVNGIVHFGDQQIFDGAMTYTCLLFLGKQPTSKFDFVGVRDLAAWQKGGGFTKADLPSSKLELPEWTFSASQNSSILERICTSNPKLADVADRIFQGLVTGADPVFILEKRSKGVFYSEALEREVQLEPDLLHPLCKGSVNVRRYEIDDVTKSILFPYHIGDEKAVLIPANEFSKKYPKCWHYLGENRKALEGRERGKWHHDKWYAFGRSQNLAEMEQEKILTPSIAKRASFTHDLDDFYYFIGSGGGGGGGYSRGYQRD